MGLRLLVWLKSRFTVAVALGVGMIDAGGE